MTQAKYKILPQLALMLVDTSLLNDRLNNLISAHSSGLSLEAYRLKKSVDKYDAGGKR